MAYIKKETLEEEIEKSIEEIDLRFPRGRAVKEALEIVKKHIDSVPETKAIVFCCECEHFGPLIGNGKHHCKNYQLPYCEPNDFCSYAKGKKH